jgi:hypothetical protein
MNIEIAGLVALGILNLALGLLIVSVCLRLSTLSKLIADVEGRISRLEILTNLADSRNSREERVAREKAGGIS